MSTARPLQIARDKLLLQRTPGCPPHAALSAPSASKMPGARTSNELPSRPPGAFGIDEEDEERACGRKKKGRRQRSKPTKLPTHDPDEEDVAADHEAIFMLHRQRVRRLIGCCLVCLSFCTFAPLALAVSGEAGILPASISNELSSTANLLLQISPSPPPPPPPPHSPPLIPPPLIPPPLTPLPQAALENSPAAATAVGASSVPKASGAKATA